VLKAADRPYIIENVTGARSEMLRPILLCGSMFGLEFDKVGESVARLQRHRLFECSFPVYQRKCRHDSKVPVLGVYGGHARIRAASWGGRTTRDDWSYYGGHLPVASRAMGIDWMTLAELSEAIPPDYTRFIGRQLLVHLRGEREPA
jgi:DNA (cytosine-5)-methyltransferase 1